MLELIRRAPAWRLHTKLYSFDPNLGEGLCVFPSFPFPDSGLNLSNCFDFYFDLLWKKKLKTSNSIPWCTSFHVILSLRTWHIMITTLQHARNEHRSARCVWFPNMFRFSSFCFWEYWVSWYSLCFKEEFQRYFEGLHMSHWSVENYLCARSQLQTQSMRLGNWKVHQENRNHDLSKKWLQQNSRYAVKVIAKGGFISASRSKELNLQLQLQINFNLSMRQKILRITRYWLPQSSRKYPG